MGNSMEIDKSKMVAPNGKAATQGLFIETNGEKKFAVYTIKDYDFEKDGVLYPSLKQLYMNHPGNTPGDGEYDFVMTYLVSWKQWKFITNSLCYLNGKPIKKHIEEWREELSIKRRCEAIRKIIETSDSNYQAQKWVAEKGYEVHSKGTPRKADIAKAAKEEAGILVELQNDWEILNEQSAKSTH